MSSAALATTCGERLPVVGASLGNGSAFEVLKANFMEAERQMIVEALRTHGLVTKAALSLNVSAKHLHWRMRRLGVTARGGRRELRPHRSVTEKKGNLLAPPMPPTKMPRLKNFVPIKCLCCGQSVNVPDLEIIIDYYKVPPCEQRVLRAVWKGEGRPVQTERIFDSMYLDDPDGGPSPDAMYRAFKALMHNIRCRLVGSGITIESVGYRQGYRIVIGDGSNG